MITWEYNTIIDAVNSMAESVSALDEAGRDGWEVIAVHSSAYGYTYLMKRPLPPTETAKTKTTDGVEKHNHSIDRPCRAACPWFGTSSQIQW